MGHCISVYLINRSELRDEKIDIIIKDKTVNDIIWTELKSDILATPYIPNIRSWGKGKTIAKITTDYFGGAGYQTAKLFVDNKKVYDKSDEETYRIQPINDVLKMMGIISSSHNHTLDEFDTIGLSNYRSNDDFNK